MRSVSFVAAYALLAVYPLSFYLASTFDVGLVRVLQVGYAISCAGWLMLLGRIWRDGSNRLVEQPPVGGIVCLLLAAVLLRLALLPAPPSDDVHRYVWEGRVRIAGFNPYVLAPDDERLAHLRDDSWAQINHPDHPAIYPPWSQALCAGVAAVCPHPFAVKVLVLAADLLTILVLVAWLRRRGEDPRWVAVYALCPVVLSAFARQAHLDAVMVLALAYFLQRCDPSARDEPRAGRASRADGTGVRRAVLTGAVLGFAVGAKWVPLLLLPWWVVWVALGAGKRIRDFATPAVGLASAVVVLAIPALFYADAGRALIGPLRSFADNFHNLDAARQVLALALNPTTLEWTARGIVLVTIAATAFRRVEPARAALWTIGTAMLLAPTFHPWYLTWLLPALCVRRAWPWLVLAVTMVFAYEGDHLRETTGDWSMPAWVVKWVFAPFFAAVALQAAARLARRVRESRQSPSQPTTSPPA